jgi:REP element-mobilizing transposase RayT
MIGADMPQSLSSVLLHIVFSTKNREPFINPEIETELHRYMAEVFRTSTSPALLIGGTSDHVHCLVSLSRTITIAALMEEVKTESSKWIKSKGPEFRSFHWQNGYGAFSIGESNVNDLKAYIAGQKEHHETSTFQDEYRKILRKYKIEFDERYVWD